MVVLDASLKSYANNSVEVLLGRSSISANSTTFLIGAFILQKRKVIFFLYLPLYGLNETQIRTSINAFCCRILAHQAVVGLGAPPPLLGVLESLLLSFLAPLRRRASPDVHRVGAAVAGGRRRRQEGGLLRLHSSQRGTFFSSSSTPPLLPSKMRITSHGPSQTGELLACLCRCAQES